MCVSTYADMLAHRRSTGQPIDSTEWPDPTVRNLRCRNNWLERWKHFHCSRDNHSQCRPDHRSLSLFHSMPKQTKTKLIQNGKTQGNTHECNANRVHPSWPNCSGTGKQFECSLPRDIRWSTRRPVWSWAQTLSYWPDWDRVPSSVEHGARWAEVHTVLWQLIANVLFLIKLNTPIHQTSLTFVCLLWQFNPNGNTKIALFACNWTRVALYLSTWNKQNSSTWND